MQIDDAVIEEIGEVEYTGSPIIPELIITAHNGEIEFVQNLDYEIAISDNVNVGDVNVLVSSELFKYSCGLSG